MEVFDPYILKLPTGGSIKKSKKKKEKDDLKGVYTEFNRNRKKHSPELKGVWITWS